MNALADEHLGVVLVDDDAAFREIIIATLASQSSFVLFEAASGDELVEVLNHQRIDCIVLDYDLGMETGLGVVERIDELAHKRLPIIMMTGDGRQSTAIRAFRMGVADYIPKHGLRPEILIRTVLDVVERHRRELLSEAEGLRLLAASTSDAKTGLESRTSLDERLALLAALPPASQAQYGLILVEIDGYKGIVERFGFKMADQALRAIARKLPGCTRSSDVCGRYEEAVFLVIGDVQSDEGLLERICRRLAADLEVRLTSDVADLRLSVRIAGALALLAPAVRGGATDGSRFLDRVKVALAQVELSGTVALVARSGAVSPGALEMASGPAGQWPDREASDGRPAADELRSSDRRQHVRQRVLKRGVIHIPGVLSTVNCTVRNLSPGGAGLRLEAPCAVPDTFDLEVVGSGAKQRVQVRWQLARDLGVEFVRAPADRR